MQGDVPNAGDLVSPDKLYGGTGNDGLQGGDGSDKLYGGDGNDQIVANGGDDHVSGGAGDDTVDAGPGNDTVYANVGVDHIAGGAGNDDLWALARADVHPGPNGETDTTADTVDGGPGDDTIHTRDGEADQVTCGDGNDTALLDTVDVITDATAANPSGSCEHVVRKAPKAADQSSSENSDDNGPAEPSDN
jgi:Ca2+-binding RTX toxin-like protein